LKRIDQIKNGTKQESRERCKGKGKGKGKVILLQARCGPEGG